MPIDALSVLFAQLTRDLLAIAKFLFYYIFSFFFAVLVVRPHHDHPVTTVLTHYFPMA